MSLNLNVMETEVNNPPEGKFACPYCKKPVASDAHTCVHCNGPLFGFGEETVNPHCPRCQNLLTATEIDGGDEGHLCLACHGLWLDLESFKRATNPQQVSKNQDELRTNWYKPNQDPVQYLSCPRCGRLMNRENFSKISGIMIDHCRDHGVWLDAGELERIRLFIVSGGLEKFQDHRLDMIEEKLQSVSDRTNQLEFMTKLLHFWNPKRILFQGTIFH